MHVLRLTKLVLTVFLLADQPDCESVHAVLGRPQLVQPEKDYETGKNGVEIHLDDATGKYTFRWKSRSDGKYYQAIKQSASRIDVRVSANVSIDKLGYWYQYEIENMKQNKNRLQTFVVTIPGGAHLYRSPSTDWLGFFRENDVQWSMTEPTVPGIEPGGKVSGFDVLSSGLPTIVNCRAAAYTKLLECPEDCPEETMTQTLPPWKDMVSGRTIGPAKKIQPGVDERVFIIQRLLADLQAARQEGWIGCDKVLNELQTDLKTVAEAVQRSNAEAVKETAGSLCNLVEKDYSNTPPLVTTEVHSLVTVNCQWLLRQYEN